MNFMTWITMPVFTASHSSTQASNTSDGTVQGHLHQQKFQGWVQDTASISGCPRTDGTHACLFLSRPEHDSHSTVHHRLTTIQRCSQEDDAYKAIASTSGSSQVQIAEGCSENGPHWVLQVRLFTPWTFTQHSLSHLAVFTSGAYFFTMKAVTVNLQSLQCQL